MDHFFRQFQNLLIIILIAATGISFFLGEHLDAYVILVIVLACTVLGFVQEYRAEQAAALQKLDDFTYKDKINEIRAMVIRAYWSLALAYVAFDITEKNKKFWEDVVQVVETRYKVGRGSAVGDVP